MAELQQQYQDKLNQKEELKQKAEHTELMLDRAAKLVSGLAGERVRWEETVKVILMTFDFILKKLTAYLEAVRKTGFIRKYAYVIHGNFSHL